jgi:hypothetical protein
MGWVRVRLVNRISERSVQPIRVQKAAAGDPCFFRVRPPSRRSISPRSSRVVARSIHRTPCQGSREQRQTPHCYLFGLERPGNRVRIEDDTGRKCSGAGKREGPCRGSIREEAFPRAQQHRIDGEQHLISEPLLEQNRRQCGAAREDEIGAVLRLETAKSLDEVRSNPLERTPGKTLRAVGRDILRRRVEAVPIGELGALGQNPDQISYVRRPSSKLKRSPYAASMAARPAGVRYGTVQSP